MARKGLVSKNTWVIVVAVISACGGTTTTGTERHIDVGSGGDASVGGSESGADPSCPTSEPKSGYDCYGPPSHLGSTCSYGLTACRCINMGQNSASWSCDQLGGAGGSTGGTGGNSGCEGNGGTYNCGRIACPPRTRLSSVPGQCCPTCEPCGQVNCLFMPACSFGEQPVTPPGECCPTQCGLMGVTDAAACFGIPCSDTHGCWCSGGVAVFGIACGASGTCEACSTNGLNDPCLGRPPSSPEGPDCCPGLTCVNNRCVP
jgi:hypothetical protein